MSICLCNRRAIRIILMCSFVVMVGLFNLHPFRIKLNLDTFGLSNLFQTDENPYEERRYTLMKACEVNLITPSNTEELMKHLVLDHTHRLVYCPVAKVASTFWKRVFQVSSGVKPALSPFAIKDAHDKSLKRMKSMSVDEGASILKHYTTFLFVRDPFARLLACYVDKFFTVNIHFWKVGRFIIKKFRPNATEKAKTCGHDVTFPEFIKFVIYTLETRKYMNEHWQPINERCSPCQVQYDIIGKLETVSSDLEYLQRNHFNEKVLFEEMETESERDIIEDNARFLFSRYKQISEKCMSLKDHMRRFIKKEQIRGIIHKSVEIPDLLANKKNVGESDLIEFALNAYETNKYNSARKLNREEAFLEAYSGVHLEDLIKIQKLFQLDFDIFGYDLKPKVLFDAKNKRYKEKVYFKLHG